MIKKALLKIIDIHYVKQGFEKSWGISWFMNAIAEYKETDMPAKEKIWALKRGVYPWRIGQYGLNEENYKEELSDKEYFRLYPINGRQKMWIDDKLTVKYILRPFDNHMPKY